MPTAPRAQAQAHLRDGVSQPRVAQEQPPPWRDAIRLILEFLWLQLMKVLKAKSRKQVAISNAVPNKVSKEGPLMENPRSPWSRAFLPFPRSAGLSAPCALRARGKHPSRHPTSGCGAWASQNRTGTRPAILQRDGDGGGHRPWSSRTRGKVYLLRKMGTPPGTSASGIKDPRALGLHQEQRRLRTGLVQPPSTQEMLHRAGHGGTGWTRGLCAATEGWET